MSFFGLSLTGSALDTYQIAENVVSNNIANVGTTGASEQQAQINEAPPITATPGYPAKTTPGTVGDGVDVNAILRVHVNSWDTLYRGASSSQNYYTSQSQVLSAVQNALNEPNGGISTAYTGFQTAVSQLASETANSANITPNRSAVLQTATTLASSVNTVGNAITIQKSNVISQADTLVTTVNGILDQIGELNGEIRSSNAAGDNPNTFKDQRDTLVDSLSTYLPTETTVENNGSTLVTVNGQALVDDTVVYHLGTPTVGTSANGAPLLKVGFASDPNPTNPSAIPLGNGQIGGLVDTYNNYLQTYGNAIDSFARSLATEFNRVQTAGYDQNGIAGSKLFASNEPNSQLTAANISVALSDPSQVAAAAASTSAGTLVSNLNSANNTVTLTSPINSAIGPNAGSPLFNNPAATGGVNGTIAITVDGLAPQTFTYNSLTTDTTIGNFIQHFNAQQYGVSASFDPTGQRVIFTRDIENESLSLQAKAGYTPTSAFTITDSASAAGTQPAAGVIATSLLETLGAGKINGVQQNAGNAYGPNDNANSISMQSFFSAAVGAPSVNTVSGNAIAVGTQTVQVPAGLGDIAVGSILTIASQPGGPPAPAPQENVTVTAVNYATVPPTFTATFQFAHAAGVSIQAAQTQTLSQYYGNLITDVGFNAQNAATGQTSQTTLATNIDKTRQSIDGINLDEETQKLLEYQSAYQAAAHTFTVLDSLLNTVITQLGGP